MSVEIHEYLIEEGKCCACDAELKLGTKFVNMVMLSKKAPWKYPIWGNILAEKETSMGYAIAVACDACVDEETGQIKNPIKYAIEVQGGEQVEGSPPSDKLFTKRFIMYHKVEDLEDGKPTLKSPIKDLAHQLKADLERDNLLKVFQTILPDDPIAVSYRGAMEETNEEMLRQSAFYVMLINQTYINGLKDPEDAQHHDLIRQLMVVRETCKPTVMIFDETITDEDRDYIDGFIEGLGLDIRETITHDFSVKSPEFQEKITKLLQSLGEEK